MAIHSRVNAFLGGISNIEQGIMNDEGRRRRIEDGQTNPRQNREIRNTRYALNSLQLALRLQDRSGIAQNKLLYQTG